MATTTCEYMHMFVSGLAGGSASGAVPLLIAGAASPGYTGVLPLAVSGSPLVEDMNLFVLGGDTGSPAGSMNLFIFGDKSGSGSLPLFVCNTGQETGDFTWLFIQGAGTSPGYYPYGEGLDLVVVGAGLGSAVPHGGGIGGGTTLYVGGVAPPDSGASVAGMQPWFVAGITGRPSGSTTMFVGGVSPTAIAGSVTLVVPKTIGRPAGSLSLYVGGY